MCAQECVRVKKTSKLRFAGPLFVDTTGAGRVSVKITSNAESISLS